MGGGSQNSELRIPNSLPHFDRDANAILSGYCDQVAVLRRVEDVEDHLWVDGLPVPCLESIENALNRDVAAP